MQSYASEIEWLKSKVSEESASMLYARLADRYLKVSEIGQAIDCAEKGVLLHPHDATQRYVLAMCYFERKEFEKAEKHLNELLSADPNYIAALYLQSDILKNSGDTEKVRENYNRIIDLDPFDDTIHQKIYDLQFERKTETSKDDWNLELSTRKQEHDEWDQSQELQSTPEADDEAKWLFESQESSADDHYLDDPFADLAKSAPDQAVAEQEPISKQPVAESSASEYSDESIDDDFDIDRRKFKEEESKFTRILDNIFSSNLDEEERIEKDEMARISSDAIADEEPTGTKPPDTMNKDDFEPLLDPERIISPEEKIFWHDRALRDELFDKVDDDEIPQEPVTRDDVTADAQLEAKPNDFSEFLDSLDIQEDDTADEQLTYEKQEDTVDSTAEKELMPTGSAENEQERTKYETTRPPKADQNHSGKEKRHDDKQKGKFVTPTLGEIYAAQGQYAKAISVFETLIKNDPDNDWYQSKLDYLRRKLAEQHN